MTLAYLFAALGPDDTPATSQSSLARLRAEEDALVARLRRGDTEALETIYRAYHPAMCDVAARYLRDDDAAEDAVHDVFRMLWERRDRLIVDGTLATYLFGAVRHRALNVLRHVGVVRRAADVFAEYIPAMGEAAPPTDRQSDIAALEMQVLQHLQALPERTRTLVLLRWKHGLAYSEIAAALGMSPEAAKKLGQRVQSVLRPLLTELKEA